MLAFMKSAYAEMLMNIVLDAQKSSERRLPGAIASCNGFADRIVVKSTRAGSQARNGFGAAGGSFIIADIQSATHCLTLIVPAIVREVRGPTA